MSFCLNFVFSFNLKYFFRIIFLFYLSTHSLRAEDQLKEVAVITGAGRSLGLELALKMLEANKRVVLTARDQSFNEVLSDQRFSPYWSAKSFSWLNSELYDSKKLIEEMAQDQADRLVLFPLDLFSPEYFFEKMKDIESIWGGVDILIHNASFTKIASAQEGIESLRPVFTTNLFSPIDLSTLFIEYSRPTKNKRRKIIYFSSAAAILPRDGFAAYSSSKAGAENFFLSLSHELKKEAKRNKNVSDYIQTEITVMRISLVNSSYDVKIHYSKNSENLYQKIDEMSEGLRALSPTTEDDIARKVLQVIDRVGAQHLDFVHVGIDGIFTETIRRLLPTKVLRGFMHLAEHAAIQGNRNKCTREVRNKLVYLTQKLVRNPKKSLGAGLGLVGSSSFIWYLYSTGWIEKFKFSSLEQVLEEIHRSFNDSP